MAQLIEGMDFWDITMSAEEVAKLDNLRESLEMTVNDFIPEWINFSFHVDFNLSLKVTNWCSGSNVGHSETITSGKPSTSSDPTTVPIEIKTEEPEPMETEDDGSSPNKDEEQQLMEVFKGLIPGKAQGKPTAEEAIKAIGGRNRRRSLLKFSNWRTRSLDRDN